LHHLTGSYLCNQKIFSVNSLITSFQPAKQLFEQNASNWWMSHSVFLNARLLGCFEGFFFFFFFSPLEQCIQSCVVHLNKKTR
jgi:hypothetical protein